MTEPKCVLFIRRDNIGDLVCTTPLFGALRARHSKALPDWPASQSRSSTRLQMRHFTRLKGPTACFMSRIFGTRRAREALTAYGYRRAIGAHIGAGGENRWPLKHYIRHQPLLWR